MEKLAKIISFEELEDIRESLGVIVSTSGGFDPIHSGHISYFQESKNYGDTLVVIVNGDSFLTAKKGKPFMNLMDRCNIISAIKNVDYVIPFEIKNDMTVIKALEKIKPHYFTKGGDRVDKNTIPEWNICKELEIKIITNIDNVRYRNSSSSLLRNWAAQTKMGLTK